jgi:tetratricopeptide (TPR) repeat protein
LHNNYADLLERQKDHTRALEHFQRAAAIFEATVGTSSADHALALLNICTVEIERKRPREGMAACARGLPVLEREVGPTHSLVAQVLVGSVSLAYAANGRSREAIAALDRGIAMWPTQSPARETDIADGELSFARELWDHAPHDRAIARAVAVRARKRLRDAGAEHAALRAEADAWLASHRQ